MSKLFLQLEFGLVCISSSPVSMKIENHAFIYLYIGFLWKSSLVSLLLLFYYQTESCEMGAGQI